MMPVVERLSLLCRVLYLMRIIRLIVKTGISPPHKNKQTSAVAKRWISHGSAFTSYSHCLSSCFFTCLLTSGKAEKGISSEESFLSHSDRNSFCHAIAQFSQTVLSPYLLQAAGVVVQLVVIRPSDLTV